MEEPLTVLGDAIADFLIEQSSSTVRGEPDDYYGTPMGTPIEVVGLGAFELHRHDAYDGRNPRTGEIVHGLAELLACFRAPPELAAEVDGAPPTERRYACPPALAPVLASRTGLKDEALGRNLHDALVAAVAQLHVGIPVRLGALGALDVEKREQKLGRNPQTGQEILIPGRVVLRFLVAPELGEELKRRAG